MSLGKGQKTQPLPPVPLLAALLPEPGRRHLQKFIEGPVELGEALETALKGDIRNGRVRGQQKGLGIAHSGHGDVVRQGESGDPLELMGQIIAADVEFPGQGCQRKILRIAVVNTGRDAVYFIGDIVKIHLIRVHILVPVQIDQAQKFRELVMNGQIGQFVGSLGEIINIIQLLEDHLFDTPLKAVDGNLSLENAVDRLHIRLQAGGQGGNGKIDNKPLVGRPFRIGGLVQQGGTDGNDITAAQVMPCPVDQMARVLVQENAHLIKLMEMLKLHINRIGTLIPVKEIEKRRPLPVNLDQVFLFIY